MYYRTLTKKQDNTEIECWIKQTGDTSSNSLTSNGERIPTHDFLLRGTDKLCVGEFITSSTWIRGLHLHLSGYAIGSTFTGCYT